MAKRGLWGITRNGLPWRTGLTILVTLNTLDRDEVAIDDHIVRCARRLRDPRFGGSAGAIIDRTFAVAPEFLVGRPGAKWMS